jgi:predicted ester cyclase
MFAEESVKESVKETREETPEEIAALVRGFIEEFWNAQNPAVAERYLAADFVDHDNATALAGRPAMQEWLARTSATFDHRTVIEDQVTEGDRSILRLTFKVVQRGEFRGVLAAGKTAEARGYRAFRVRGGKIVEHWGFLDGNALVEQLKN